MKIDHISVSRQGIWEQCKQQYKFRYHLKVVSDLPQKSYFTLGKVAHKVIEEHTLNKGKKPINEIMHDVLSGKIYVDGGAALAWNDIQRLRKHVTNYGKLSEKIGFEGKTEWNFKKDLDPPNKKCVLGFIDRLIQKDDKIFIIDYKTTKVGPYRKDSTNIIKDLQLACYCWVAMTEFGIPAKNISAALYYLEDAKLVPVTFSEKTLLNIPQFLLKIYNEIESSDPDKVVGKVGMHCNGCDYVNICPWYRNSKPIMITEMDEIKLAKMGL